MANKQAQRVVQSAAPLPVERSAGASCWQGCCRQGPAMAGRWHQWVLE
jgi:hypothetical protein